ncbi:MAG: TonB-dependent receptor [Pseudomonadota bacterium]
MQDIKLIKILFLASFVSITVSAESAAQENIGWQLEEVIVTARKTTESLVDTPIAVSVLSTEFFKESGFNTITEVAKFVPGFDYSPITTTRAAAPSIRGISTFSFSEGFESSVATVIDGVVMGREAQGFFDLYDIERVEVLKGPQGTLFGKNTSAGVVNVITKKPEYDFSVGGDVLFGSHGELRFRGSVTGPLIDDKLAYRITGSKHENDGLIDNVLAGEDDVNSKDTWSVRAKLLFNPSERLSALLTLDTVKEDHACCVATYNTAGSPQDLANGLLSAVYGGLDPLLFLNVPGSVPHLQDALAAAGVTPGEGNRSVALFEDSLRHDSEAKGVALEINYDIGGATLTSITAWRDWDIDETNDQDLLGEADFFNFSGAMASAKQVSQEFRLAGNWNDSITYVGGLFYFDEEQDADGGNTLNISLAPGLLNLRNRSIRSVETTHYAIFGEVTWDVTDRLSLVFGGRYTDEEKEASAIYTETVLDPRFGFNSLGLGGGNYSGRTTVEDTDFSGRVIGRYRISDQFNTYLTFSRGYKGAGLDVSTGVNPANIAVDGELPVVQPEIPTLIELGFKGVFLDNTLSINTAIFHQTVEDYQRIIRNDDPTFTQNLGVDEIKSQGLEIDASYATPIEGLSLSASYSYMDVTYEDFVQRPDLEGTRITTVPEISTSFVANYRFDLGSTAWKAFSRLEYTWQDDKNTNGETNPRFDIDSYGLLNVRLGATSPSGKYNASLSVENVTDEDYAHAIFSSIYGLLDSTTNAQFLGPDRTIRLSLGAEF